MTKYDDIINEIWTNHRAQARKYIPQLCHALREEDEHLTNHDIVERIKKDLVDIWARSTIYEHIPDEFKDERKQEAAIQSHKNLVELSATNSGAETSITNSEGQGVVITDEDEPNPDIVEPSADPRFYVKRDEIDNKYIDKERYEAQRKDYEDLSDRYNGLQEQTSYLEEQINQLKQALSANTSAAQTVNRNPNRGFWIKFDLNNFDLTRPLFAIVNRMKDRPAQFWLEIIGDDVIEVAENRPAQ